MKTEWRSVISSVFDLSMLGDEATPGGQNSLALVAHYPRANSVKKSSHQDVPYSAKSPLIGLPLRRAGPGAQRAVMRRTLIVWIWIIASSSFACAQALVLQAPLMNCWMQMSGIYMEVTVRVMAN
jgi:hypothetical protein